MNRSEAEREKLYAILREIHEDYINGNLPESVYRDLRRKYEKELEKAEKHKKLSHPHFFHSLEFLMAFRSLKRRKVRTALTVFGIVIGVTAIVALSSVSEGMRAQMVGWIKSSLGADLIVTCAGSNQFMPEEKIPESYIQEISQMKDVVSTSSELFEIGLVNDCRALIWGLDSDAKPSHLTVISGSLPNKPYEVALGLGLKNRLGVDLNDYVMISSSNSNKEFQVVGVFQSPSMFLDDSCIIPLDSVQSLFGDEGKVSAIMVYVEDLDNVGSVRSEIERTLNGVQVIEQREILETIQQGMGMLKVFLLLVASISLLVAGLGIMNTMFMSVLERKREIGILKAIGASKSQILRAFLIETIMLGSLGGIFGCILGVIVSKLSESVAISYFRLPIVVQSTPEILASGFIFALFSATVSGLYPCWKAASLKPLEALRYG